VAKSFAMGAFRERGLSVVAGTMPAACAGSTPSLGPSAVSPARFVLTTSDGAGNPTFDRLGGINNDGGKWRLRLLVAATLVAVVVGCGGGATGGAVPSAVEAPAAASASAAPRCCLHGQATIETTTDSSLTLGAPVTATGSASSSGTALVEESSQYLWQLVTDAYSLGSDATGTITIQYTGSGSVVTTVDMANLALEGVNAYPFIFYGANVFDSYRVLGQPPTFPVQLKSLSSLIFDVDYTLSNITTPGDQDVLFDEWLEPNPTYTGAQSGALEVEVLPYYKFTYAPPGSFAGTVREPVTINGKPTLVTFKEYSTGTGPGSDVLFFPSGGQISSGEIKFDELDFLNAAAAEAEISTSWYLAGFDFGSEFGHTTSAKYTLTTKKIKIEQHFNTRV
jgi:Glycosyl hydrolase family 12